MFNNQMFYNPFYQQSNIANPGFYKPHLHFNWKNILNNTQKTLNVINQAIPVYYQIKPIYNNAKTMFRMVNALKDNDQNNNEENNTQENKKKNFDQQGPTFFI